VVVHRAVATIDAKAAIALERHVNVARYAVDIERPDLLRPSAREENAGLHRLEKKRRTTDDQEPLAVLTEAASGLSVTRHFPSSIRYDSRDLT
jgi:hypothetical protein